MAPDSLAIQLITAGAALASAVALGLVWEHRAGPAWILLRVVTAVLCLATAAATALVWVNRQIETYPTWSDLAGAPPLPTVPGPLPAAPGGAGGRLVTLRVSGGTSGLDLPLIAYLPPAYDRHPTTRFPVIEALHGFPGSPMTWLHRLGVTGYLDREIAAGRMAPTVVLFPYQTPNPLVDTECTDLTGGPKAETFLTVDVPAAARSRLRIRTDRAGWGLIGYSAGGFCATNLVLRHPTRYAAAASLSGYADPGIVVGDGSEHTLNNDAWRLRHLPVPAVALYLATSRTDRKSYADTVELARLARAPLSLATAYVSGGGHNDQTWKAMEPPAFDWLSGWLARPLAGN